MLTSRERQLEELIAQHGFCAGTDVPTCARVLDTLDTMWFLKIDTEKLDMQSTEDCIAGQLGYEWEGLAKEVALMSPLNLKEAVISFATDSAVWKSEILKRHVVRFSEV